MKRFMLLILLPLTMLAIVAVPRIVHAQDSKTAVCEGVGLTTDGEGNCIQDSNKTSIDDVIKAVVNILSFVIGVVAVIMIMIGGFKYITSSGDSSNVNSAKNTILYAIVGLVVVAVAQAIVFFTITRTTKQVPPADSAPTPVCPPDAGSCTPI